MLGLFDSATGAAIAEHGGHDPEVRAAGAVGRPNGGVADSLAEAKAAFRAAGERPLSPAAGSPRAFWLEARGAPARLNYIGVDGPRI